MDLRLHPLRHLRDDGARSLRTWSGASGSPTPVSAERRRPTSRSVSPFEQALEAEDLAVVAREVFGADRVETTDTLAAGIERAVALSEGYEDPLTSSGVLIVGSVILAAEARALFGRA